MAFGQQWRPAVSAPTPTYQPATQRFANTASFRPRNLARTGTADRGSRLSARQMTSRAQPRGFRPALRSVAPRHYPADQRRIASNRYMPQRYAPPQLYPRPGGQRAAWLPMPPFMAAAPGWQLPRAQAPHVAWRNPMPMAQPIRFERRPMVDQRYPASQWQPPVPTAGMFRPQGGFSQATPPSMHWRPVAARYVTYPRPAARVAARPDRWQSASQRPVWRAQPNAGASRVSAASPRFISGPATWRPAPGGLARVDHGFRPIDYGRSSLESRRVAQSTGDFGSSSQQTALPGWATTYDQTGRSLACDWCNGS